MKLLIDMNLSPRWASVLITAGIDAVHWSAADTTDAQLMAYAKANDYVVLTLDLDFSAILAATHGEKPSVVQLRADDASPDVFSKAVITALLQVHDELQAGALLTIDPQRARLRLLPLNRQPSA